MLEIAGHQIGDPYSAGTRGRFNLIPEANALTGAVLKIVHAYESGSIVRKADIDSTLKTLNELRPEIEPLLAIKETAGFKMYLDRLRAMEHFLNKRQATTVQDSREQALVEAGAILMLRAQIDAIERLDKTQGIIAKARDWWDHSVKGKPKAVKREEL